MSEEDRAKINKWIIDFSQASIGIKNLEILIHGLTKAQLAVANRLSFLLYAYLKVLDQDDAHLASDEKLICSWKKRLSSFAKIEKKIETDVTAFYAKCESQLFSARDRVKIMLHNLQKMKSMNQPYQMNLENFLKRVPEFLTVFDSFLSNFALQVRCEQAEYYKQMTEVLTHFSPVQSIKATTDEWWSEFEPIIAAVEALKTVNPPYEFHRQKETTNTSEATETISKPTAYARDFTETTESVFANTTKWINTKVGRDVRSFKFYNPATGFFDQLAIPEETVVAVFDFTGETESDLPFTKGAIIKVVDKGTEDDPNWWCGELNGKRGLFPKNYVTENIEMDHSDEYNPKIDSSDAQAPQLPEHSRTSSEKDEVINENEAPNLPSREKLHDNIHYKVEAPSTQSEDRLSEHQKETVSGPGKTFVNNSDPHDDKSKDGESLPEIDPPTPKKLSEKTDISPQSGKSDASNDALEFHNTSDDFVKNEIDVEKHSSIDKSQKVESVAISKAVPHEPEVEGLKTLSKPQGEDINIRTEAEDPKSAVKEKNADIEQNTAPLAVKTPEKSKVTKESEFKADSSTANTLSADDEIL